MVDCDKPIRIKYRDKMVRQAWKLHMDQYKEEMKDEEKPKWHPIDIDYLEPYMYLFGGKWNESRRNEGLIGIIDLVRISLVNR